MMTIHDRPAEFLSDTYCTGDSYTVGGISQLPTFGGHPHRWTSGENE